MNLHNICGGGGGGGGGGRNMSHVDWKHWLHMSEIMTRQAVALSMDIDPDKMTGTRTCEQWHYLDSSFQIEAEQDELN